VQPNVTAQKIAAPSSQIWQKRLPKYSPTKWADIMTDMHPHPEFLIKRKAPEISGGVIGRQPRYGILIKIRPQLGYKKTGGSLLLM